MKNISVTLKIWRQASTDAKGEFFTLKADDISPDMSFLEMLDVVNEKLIKDGSEPDLGG